MGCKVTASKSHYPKDVPFEVPEGWIWTTLGTISYDLQYGTSEKSSCIGDVPVLRMGNITRLGTIDYSDLVFSSCEEDIKKYSLQYDDLLFNRTNSSEWVGKTAIFKSKRQAIYAGYLIRVRTIGVVPDYLNLVMNSTYHRDWCNQVKTDAVNQSNINAQKLSKYLVPIPPITEQYRIIVEADQLFTVIAQLFGLKEALSEQITQAKAKVLDLAIHGKLVPQDPADEPVINMLRRINPGFQPSDNLHYEDGVKKGWIRCLVSNAFEINPKIVGNDEDECAFIPMALIPDGYSKELRFERKKWSTIKKGFTRFADGDIGVAKISPCLENRKSVVFRGLPSGIGAGTTELIIFRPVLVTAEYGLLFFKSQEFIAHCKGSYSGVVGQQRVDMSEIKCMYISIPPISEQTRIVKTVEMLFSQLDRIQCNNAL